MSNKLNLVSEETFVNQTDKIATAITAAGGGTVDTEMSDSSENAVQNKVIKHYVDANAYAPFIVTMSLNGANLVADKTFGEIKAAADDFKSIIIKTEIEGQLSQILFISSIAQLGNSFIVQVTSLDNTVKSLTGAQNDYPTLSLE